MPKQQSKSRDWEKERRNRINDGFTNLHKKLPTYDPAVTASKVEILQRAAAFIEELTIKVGDLLSTNASEPTRVKEEEIVKLQERVKRLLGKNEQLCILLREAKIPIPPGCGFYKKFQPPSSWSNRIGPEQALILQKKEAEKENNANCTRKTPIKKLSSKPKKKLQSTPKHRKAILNRSDVNKQSKIRKRKLTKKQAAKCVIVISQPTISQSCYVITNTTSNGSSLTGITNSGLVKVSSNQKNVQNSVPLPSLGPGTLILANGTIMPVIPQQTVLPSILTNSIPRPTNQTLILLSNQSISNDSIQNTIGTKTLSRIKPKYCLTQTTQVNKVPIPALTSRYSNNELVLNKNYVKSVKGKKGGRKTKNDVKESVKRKLISENNDESKKIKIETEINKVVEDFKEKELVVGKIEAINVVNENNLENQSSHVENIKTFDLLEKPKEILTETIEIHAEKTVSDEIVKVSEKENLENESNHQELDLNINHSELSNDIFASLQVPTGGQNPDSTSPTAAFLLAFPLVSSGVKVTEVTEEDNSESQHASHTLLQIGTMETTKPTQSESLTPSLLNLDNLSFFSTKDMSGFYNSLDTNLTVVTTASSTIVNAKITKNIDITSSSNIQDQQEKTTFDPCFLSRDLLPTNHLNQSIDTYNTKKIYSDLKPNKENCLQGNLDCLVSQKSFNVQNNYLPEVMHSKQNIVTCNYTNVIKNYPDPLYTNSNTSYNNNYHSDANFSHQNYYKKNDYSMTNYDYADYRKSDTLAPNYFTNTSKFSSSSSIARTKNTNLSSKAPINWMTTPDCKTTTDYGLPQFNKDNNFSHNNIYSGNTQTSYFNSYNTNSNSLVQESKKVLSNSYHQKNEANEENQFSWSPTKLQFLEPSHSIVSNTLPTLVGDLALNFNTNEKNDKLNRKQKNYVVPEMASNFLSVSQLVDHGKEQTAARTATRRYSGGNNKVKKAPVKTNQGKKLDKSKIDNKVPPTKNVVNYHQSNESFYEKSRSTKNTNNYSAEALIGHQIPDITAKNQRQGFSNNKSLPVPFLGDNTIMPYLPVDLTAQDNNYMQHHHQNQNYQSISHNFSTNYTNSYAPNTFMPTATTMTSTYLGSNNFMHEMTTSDYSDNLNLFSNVNKEKVCTKSGKNLMTNPNLCAAKKTKRVKHNEMPNFGDFSFLTIPGSINSPILPDEFHSSHNFLQPVPVTNYSTKNSLYSSANKQNDLLPLSSVGARTIAHPEISPSTSNLVAGGTSLINFNLSTILPEINNKQPGVDSYLEPRNKEHRSYNSTTQGSFNEKPGFGYINSTSQSFYPRM